MIILIIIIPKTISDGIRCGINLCLHQVIPSLLPFILITNIMINYDSASALSKLFYPFLHKIFGVTKNGCFAVIISYLSGFPIGAKTIGQLYKTRQISKKEASHLMTFCNNCSISFAVNYLGLYCLKGSMDTITIILFIFAPPLLVGIINQFFFQYDTCIIINNNAKVNIVKSTLLTLGKISIYVICFCIIAQLLQLFSFIYKNQLLGILEITTGLSAITSGQLSFSILCSAFICCAFGGFCTMFQAFSFIEDNTIKKYYIYGKIEQCFILIVMLLIYYKVIF